MIFHFQIKQKFKFFFKWFGPQDFKIYRNVIRHNLIDHTKVLIKGTRKLDIPLLQENNKLAQKFLKEAQLVKGQIPSDTISNIKRLWNDPALKITFNSRSELQIPDTAGLFLDDLDRITASNYQPTNNDILSCRIPTTGVRMLSFDHKGSPWRVIDVGGQRSERRKWIHHFDNVSVIVYVVALNEYDQKLFEDESVNRLTESLNLFKETINNEYFEKTNCIVLFNKTDLFANKLKKIDLSKYFPRYQGGSNFENACDFIKTEFIRVGTKKGRNKSRFIISHFTCATNTNSIKEVFRVIQSRITSFQQGKV
ncbi:heterotrimeric g protein alpha subunit b [Anaeramoeba ignava]|uniref:Heterotrimeric g protein alpha subunit b n=1 Tax=Anaeramoeba ignava TaxID=1746090 RepID=A0A9Q0LKB1_ANAIG|nr:heterotrimeric g protein alpha subunit b [Anaeramoeba ignava]